MGLRIFLNWWQGLEIPNTTQIVPLRRPSSHTSSERTSSYRFSMANLEETHEAELDAILGELSILEQRNNDGRMGRTHSRSNSTISGVTNSTISSTSTSSESGTGSGSECPLREPRTDSPDNDSAFSDTVSLLSSESSASSGVSSAHLKNLPLNSNLLQCDSAKAAKIHLALQKLEQASVRRLFVKAFSHDGASKSLLVDERMTCGHVTRLLADKNHVPMEPHWAIVEHLPELQMERLFEDHELLVDNLMNWNTDSKNRVLFLQRPDKVALFSNPEKYLPGTQMAPGSEHDEQTRSMLLEEFFASGNNVAMEGPLFLKSDSKKCWKRYHFVLRASGLYYFPKEKTKSSRDLLCHGLFNENEVYKGIGWKKKHKAPTEYAFALKSQKDQCSSKTLRSLKMLCAEDAETLDKWITAIRIAKYGKLLFDNYRVLLEDLTREELEKFSANRCGSIGSIISSVPSQCSTGSGNSANNLATSSNGRLSRASSSSSSGCLSDENNGFDSEFPTGTIKRKPSMKPNLPLTSMTRQLKEVGETNFPGDNSNPTSPERGGTLTRRHSRRRSEESNGSGTLKRRPAANRGSMESMSSSTSSATPTPSTPGTPLANLQPNLVINNNINLANNNNNIETKSNIMSPLESMPSCMTDSTFSLPPPPDDLGNNLLNGSTLSLDSLPPPPPPLCELSNEFSASQVSLVSLPPPPPDLRPVYIPTNTRLPPADTIHPITHFIVPQTTCYNNTLPTNLPSTEWKKEPQPIYSKTIKPSIKAPPYKSPPPYNGTNPPPIAPPATTKSVSFADSPVLLRRKVCFEDQIQSIPLSPRRSSKDTSSVPLPPPRAEATRLSTITSPKRLLDSTSNPPTDFLKDLQRVMRKKWQVAQKCKLEPATTPQEVLGFRDFTGDLPLGSSPHFYRETSNVSNWVQEHYGGGDSLYENLGADMGMEPTGQIISLKKRPPPPPPKRSTTTQLTTQLSNRC
ncbi:ras-associated and pleckstrin homology domains-containing protein 1 isoform X3 [Bradysia coprophila]|uniref:ras-associated and pleckstrin homology domains-containing protein 1 isoform X3 n=1 Tax=Bradysia coprophila TaxID=38358 RepID=UPI00187DDA85|nr:ras-associated and pleckstrin homology domains-containing protein 1 isoform X3 [Bradysia coprophila]